MSIPAMKVFYDKDRGEVVPFTYDEVLPPDVNAARLWLFNRQPARWRERREIDLSGTIQHRIEQMTPEERLARLRELQAKAGLIIEAEVIESSDVEPESDQGSDGER